MSERAEKPATDLTSVLLASAEDLAVIKLDEVLATVSRANDLALEKALGDAAEVAEQAGNAPAQRAYRLLAILCTFHMRVDDRANVWGPRFEGPEGRAYQASDLRGAQTVILAPVVERITHPWLRARVADVVWYNDRKQGSAAAMAVEAYCQVIAGRLDGTYGPPFEGLGDSIRDVVRLFHRALQINAGSQRRGHMPEVLRKAFTSLYSRAEASSQYVAFVELAELGLLHSLLTWDAVAPAAERLAGRSDQGTYPMAVQGVWDLAARGYGRLGDEPSKRRCQERSIDQTLQMRDQVGQASARAYWTRKAIGELRAAGGFQDRVAALRAELRDHQEASLDELTSFSIPLDVSQEQAGTIEVFEGLTLPDVFLRLALLTRGPTIKELREQALESLKESPLASMFGATYMDHEGKTVAEAPPASLTEEPDDAWIKAHSLQHLDVWRHQVVRGGIDPARQVIMMRFPIEERHLLPITEMSPFVPLGHEHLFALGFARFMQGDQASAVHLLVPQLENSMRHVLLNSARESSKIKPDLLQEDRSLSGLLENFRPELDTVFGADLIHEVDLLFHHKPGPALRHELAHGKLSASACYHPSAVYACWLIYQLTCIPLLPHWKDHVGPAIEQATF